MTSRNIAVILMMIDRQQQMEQERLDHELSVIIKITAILRDVIL